jgi:hypothetical protein
MSQYLPEVLGGLAEDAAGAIEDVGDATHEFYQATAEKAVLAARNVTDADGQITGEASAIGGAADKDASDLPGPSTTVQPDGNTRRINISDLDLESESPELAEFLRFAARTYGDRFVLHDWTDDVRSNVEKLSLVAATVHERVAQYIDGLGGNAGLYFGEGGVPQLDDLGRLAGVRPRGYPEGSTWDDVTGANTNWTGVLTVGTGPRMSSTTSLHEFGHLADEAYAPGDKASMLHSWDIVYRYVRSAESEPGTIQPYYLQSGDVGKEEMFAQAFALYHTPKPGKWLADLAGSQAGGEAIKRYFGTLLGLS